MLKKLFSLLFISICAIQCSLQTPDDLEPLVSIIYPFSGAFVTENTFTITVEASDENKVDKVWIYFDGEIIAEFTKKPYELQIDISNKKDGQSHSIQAFAEDKEGNIGSSTNVTFTIAGFEDASPTANIVYPQSGSVLSGVVDIAVVAQDNEEVDYIEYYIDGSLAWVDTDVSDGWVYSWNTEGYDDGNTHYLYVIVYDNNGNGTYTNVVNFTVTVPEDITAPTVSVIYPLNNSVLKKGTVNIFADITNDNDLVSAEFVIDGEILFTDTDGEPYLFAWDNTLYADNAQHSIFVQATDTAGNIGYSTFLTVTVSGDLPGDSTPPEVLVLYPVNGLVLSGIITLNANVRDDIGVTRVEFYIDGNLLGIDTDYPYSLNWDTEDFADSQIHTVFIKAFDAAGNEGVSNIITVTVIP